jgi:hypothetical protein
VSGACPGTGGSVRRGMFRRMAGSTIGSTTAWRGVDIPVGPRRGERARAKMFRRDPTRDVESV